MKALNHLEIAQLVQKTARRVLDGMLQRAFMPCDYEIALDVRVPGENVWVLISFHTRLFRVHEIPGKPKVPPVPPAFCMGIRKNMAGGRIVAFESKAGERVVTIAVQNGDTLWTLVCELFGPGANALMIDPDGIVVDALFPKRLARRGLTLGQKYVPPEITDPPDGLVARDFGDQPAEYFGKVEKDLAFSQERSRLTGALGREKKRCEKYLKRLKSDLEKLEPPENLSRIGELLAIHTHKIKRGMKSVQVPDIYQMDSPDVEIALDPKLDGAANKDAYFAKARKNRKRIEGLAGRIDQMEERYLQILEACEKLEDAKSSEDLDMAQQAMEKLDIKVDRTQARKKIKREVAGPKEYTSKDGVRIVVGRNARENDEITFRVARGNDYWLHVLGERSSHVVVLLPKGGELPQETLLDAATLALINSRLSRQGYGEVTYTRRKYVTKPKGAPAGSVIYSQAKTIYLKIDPERTARLLGKKNVNY